MSVRSIIEDLAKATALTDAADLNGLVDLQDKFKILEGENLIEDLSELVDLAEKASEFIDQIVLRETEDEQATFKLIERTVEFAQTLMDAVESGKTGDELPTFQLEETRGDPVPEAGAIDEELLEAWISGCDFALADLENNCVEIDSAENPEELISEARRTIHTLKGEAGVLSLHVAQKLCHDAETLIDVCTEQSNPFPVDSILALIDWMKAYLVELATNPYIAPPEHGALAIQLRGGTQDTSDATSPEPQEAEGEAPTGEADVDVDADTDKTNELPSAALDSSPIEYPDDLGMDENLGDFTCEAREHLDEAEQTLLELEEDFTNVELINTIFRAFHTIKGVAGFMNLTPIVELAHTAETMLDRARNGDLLLNSAYLDLILESCDFLRQLIMIFDGGTPPTKGALVDLVQRLKVATEGQLDDRAVHEPAGADVVPLGEILVGMGIVSEEALARAIDLQEQGAKRLQQVLLEAELFDVIAVERELRNDSEVGRTIQGLLVEIGLIEKQHLQDVIIECRESNKRIGQLLKIKADDLAPALREQRKMKRESATPPAEPDSKPAPAEKSKATSKAAPPSPAGTPKVAGRAKRIDQTVKVNTGRLDSLVDMVGELVIAQQMVVQDPEIDDIKEQRTQRNLTHVGKIIRDLQEVAMALRMVTVKGTFQKMARLVRDVASKAGKEIKFNMEGEETELDRNVVEAIGDPLVHMIRNSCDHGIETAAERIAAGKPPIGQLTLRAFHQGGSIIIEVEDDGRGLPREKILKKAIERGIYPADKSLDDISDNEVFGLIFQAGFSTAEKVTDISGRGVGMDVVRRNIESLRGKVDIRSKQGKGSVFSIRLPLTLAIIDGMIMRVGNQRYVVPTLTIEQSFQPKASNLHTVNDKGEMVSVRGSLLPIYRLNRIFEVKDSIDSLQEALLVVLETAGSRCCLMVDEIIGQQQVVIKTLGQGIQPIRGVSGGAILGDGRVALILDVDGLVREATSRAA